MPNSSSRISRLAFLVVATLLLILPAGAADVVTYAGGTGKETFNCVMELSDGTILIGGVADDLNWLSGTTVDLPASANDGWALPSAANGYANRYGFILHLNADLSVKRIYKLPQGKGGAVMAIKTTSEPGDATGSLLISGESDDSSHAWWLAKLDANGVTATPAGFTWGFNKGKGTSDTWVGCDNTGNLRHSAIWDVGGDGKVVFYDYSSTTWGTVQRVKADGSGLDTIPSWWNHGNGYNGLISLKPGNANLRSTTATDYNLVQSHKGPDAKSKKKGKYPYDYYYSIKTQDGDNVTGWNDGGYTGYSSDGKTSDSFCVTIDRRNNDIYMGIGNGNPQNTHDFEAMLIKFNSAGEFQWFTRMKDEWVDANDDGVVDSGETYQSAPDQYADEVAIDYSKDQANAEVLIFTRSHGNADKNFWGGASNNGDSFHNGFTGNNGNEHLGWLGRFKGSDSTFVDSTWVAEYDPWGSNFGSAYSDTNLNGWPDHNAGWASLKSTWGHGLVVDLSGRAYLYGTGRGPLTTANAWQQMPIPNSSHSNGYGPWSDFIRVHTADFTSLTYSSSITDPYTSSDGNGGGNVSVSGIFPTSNGVLVVGKQDKKGTVDAGALTTQNKPAWGVEYQNTSTSTTAPDAVFAKFLFSSLTPLETWRNTYWNITTNTGNAANTADPDGDGIANLLEYALGGDPKANNASILPTVATTTSGSDTYLTLTFKRERSDLTYTVQASSDLVTWTDLATPTGTLGQNQTVTDTTALTTTDSKRFLRLKVSE
jgi:hypothetical protein